VLAWLAVTVAPQATIAGAATGGEPAITDYIGRGGDQVITVPNGTYQGGSISADHPATDGPYHGWLVLQAESPHGVVVDLSRNPLVLDVGTSRVLFVGFKFIDGTIDVRGDNIAFWYTEHTFPIERWNQQFQAAGGNAAALTTMANGVPKAIWIGNQTQGRTVHATQILGADVHDVGDDGVYVDKSQGAVIDGTRIWNVEKKTYDPGYNPWVPGMNDLMHNDAVQVPGAVTDLTVADSYLGQTVTVGGDNESSADLNWTNLWIAGADGVGLNFAVHNGFSLTGSMRDIRAWSNGMQHPTDSGWDQLRVDIVDSRQVVWPVALNDPHVNIASLGTSRNQCPPPGVAMSGRRMVDSTQALDSSLNPANIWRAAHPYDSWPDLFTAAGAAESQVSVDQPVCTNAVDSPARATPGAKAVGAAPRAPVGSPPAASTHNSPTTGTEAVPAPVLPAETGPAALASSPQPTVTPPGERVLAGPAVAVLPNQGPATSVFFRVSALALLLIGVGALLLRRRSP
jgi:hypothetical protein